MECPDCRQSNPPAARFCTGCGRRLAVVCAGCRAPNPPGSRFCGACGLSLPPEGGAAGRRFGPPARYTPPHLLERILTSRLAVEGERKQVTVLFADLKGSLELLADRDPEDARALLDSVLERMMDAVHLYEGTVNQVLGDGVMALFGAPLAHEDHAVRACYAALRIQQSVERYAEDLRRREGIDLLVRVGVNSGEVVVRSISSDLHVDYTAVGQTTHLAARMEQLARPGTILVTGATARLVAGYVDLRPLGSAPVKGVAEPVELFEVVGRGPVRSRLDAAAARGLTRLVGREAELQAVYRVVERVAGGHGQVVGITGEPGVGKSRLVWELIHSPRMAGWLTLEGSGVPYGKPTPYLPVLALLRAYFQIEEADDERRIREKVSGKVLGLDEGFGGLLPPILTLLDVPVEDPKWQ
ncbi:MAG TPA: adenylate/guanylate cyclase domain-containing protein, partial [Methylomirabilota bacterium]|nr:adenylate/guanylate cyclase domain-containing protein [Methylomirabilota bacterium]